MQEETNFPPFLGCVGGNKPSPPSSFIFLYHMFSFRYLIIWCNKYYFNVNVFWNIDQLIKCVQLLMSFSLNSCLFSFLFIFTYFILIIYVTALQSWLKIWLNMVSDYLIWKSLKRRLGYIIQREIFLKFGRAREKRLGWKKKWS